MKITITDNGYHVDCLIEVVSGTDIFRAELEQVKKLLNIEQLENLRDYSESEFEIEDTDLSKISKHRILEGVTASGNRATIQIPASCAKEYDKRYNKFVFVYKSKKIAFMQIDNDKTLVGTYSNWFSEPTYRINGKLITKYKFVDSSD